MKICFVVSVYPRKQDDLEVPWLRKTVGYLCDAGYEVTVYAPSFRGIRSHEIDGCKVKRFRYFLAPWETLTHDEGAPNKIHKFHYKVITCFYIFFGILGLIRLHRKEKFDVLHVHWPFPHGLFGIAASWFHKTKIVLSFYAADLLLVKRYPFVKRFLVYFIRHADQVIGISTFTTGLVREMHDRPVHIIPYGATVAPRNTNTAITRPYHILSVGRVIERKGFEYLIKAMPDICKQWPDAHLTIAGGGPLRDSLVELSKSLGVQEKVALPGKVPQETLEKYFEECAVFVLPSIVDSKGDTEGLGVVLIEAMTYFKPVIGTDIGGIVDIIIHNETGILVPQRDPGAIEKAVNRILSEPALVKKLTEKGCEHVQKNFSWPSVIDRFKHVYDSLF
jgi:glycosyltransferase involved in cell wall biosynthesis